MDDPNPVKFVKECSPALLTWCTHVLPRGFFPALICSCFEGNLLHVFSLPGEKQLRRAVYLNSQDSALLLVDQTSWFELHFAGEIQKFPLMLEAVEESSRHLANRMKIRGYGELMRGIRCSRVSCAAPFIHPGIILPQSSMAECTMREAYRFQLSPKQKHWINSNSGEYVKNN